LASHSLSAKPFVPSTFCATTAMALKGSGTARGVWLAHKHNPALTGESKHLLIEVEHLVRDLKELLASLAAHDDGYLRDQQVQRERLTQLPW
jgi:hypothetical protein